MANSARRRCWEGGKEEGPPFVEGDVGEDADALVGAVAYDEAGWEEEPNSRRAVDWKRRDGRRRFDEYCEWRKCLSIFQLAAPK